MLKLPDITEITDEVILDKTPPPKASLQAFQFNAGQVKRPIFTYAHPSNSTKRDGEGFYKSEYPLIDIGAAEDTDSYVFQAIAKKIALGMKEGFNFVGRNPETINYIKERISQIEISQGQSLRSLVVEILGTCLRYNACYIVKARSAKASGGKVRRIGQKIVNPVAGYFVASPDTMLTKIGKDYKVKAYKHCIDGRSKIFNPEDVIYISINKKPHFISPTPPWHPVIEDIQALRRIEEHVENLVYQHIYPLFQYKVGTENFPMERYEDGLTEVDIIKVKLANMPSDGMVVTPERHEIKGLSSQARSLVAEPYIQHFKNRVITGTGMSQLDFGEGDTANRSTADSLSKLATGNVKFYQQCIADSFNFEIIKELLEESNFKFDVLAPENKVELQFVEIDHETQIKLQNHYFLLFEGNMISRTEARRLCGWEAISEEDEADTHLNIIDMKRLDKEGEIGIKASEAKASQAARTKQQPTNQYGKAQGPTKRRSSVEKDSRGSEIYGRLSEDVRNLNTRNLSLDFVRQLLISTESEIKRLFKPVIRDSMIRGAKDFVLTRNLLQKLQVLSDRISNEYENDIDRLFREVRAKIIAQATTNNLEPLTIDNLEFRVRFIERTLAHKAFILGKAIAMQENGISKAVIQSNPEGEDFDDWNNVVIDLNTISIEDLPPFHVNCSCDLVPVGELING